MIDAFYAKLKGRERTLFVVATVCVVMVLMDRLVIGPILSQMKLMDAEILAKTQTVRRNMRILSFRDSILTDYSRYSTYFDSVNRKQEEIISRLLKEIESIAAQKSITIINIKPGDVQENPVFHEYKTTLECSGKLLDLLGFMSLLEESDYLFKITEFSVTPKSKNSDVMKCIMNVTRVLMTAENVPSSKVGSSEAPPSSVDASNSLPLGGEPA